MCHESRSGVASCSLLEEIRIDGASDFDNRDWFIFHAGLVFAEPVESTGEFERLRQELEVLKADREDQLQLGPRRQSFDSRSTTSTVTFTLGRRRAVPEPKEANCDECGK